MLDLKLTKTLTSILSVKPANTQRPYKGALSKLAEYLSVDVGDDAMLKLEISDATAFYGWLQKKGLGENTIKATIAALRSIYRELVDEDLIARNPFSSKRLAIKAQPEESTKAYTDEEVRRLFSALEGEGNARDKALFSVMFNVGMRLSDALALRVDDVRTVAGSTLLRIRDKKTRTSREITLAGWAAKPLMSHIKDLKPKDPIFAIDATTARRRMKYYCHMARIPYYGPHSARATVVTHLLESGEDYGSVASVTGHSRIDTIRIYDKRRLGIADAPSRKLKY